MSAVLDINQYLKTDSTLVALSGKGSLDIYPAVAYEDDAAPVILWWASFGTASHGMEYFRVDNIRYRIYDTDSYRCLRMGERIVRLLNLADYSQKNIPSPSYMIKWSFLVRGEFDGPEFQREGWYSYTIDFEVSWLPVAS